MTRRSRDKVLIIILRLFLLFAFITAFIPALNPARVSGLMHVNNALFTNVVSYGSITFGFGRAINSGWIEPFTLTVVYIGAIVCGIAIALLGASFCMTLGNAKLRLLGVKFIPFAALAGFIGASVLRAAYNMLHNSPNPERLVPAMPIGNLVFYIMFAVLALCAVVVWLNLPKPPEGQKCELDPKYRLFLMILPFLVLVFLFAYLPLWGWRFSFFDFRPGFPLSMDDFVGFEWFRILFQSEATRSRVAQVLTNTLAMSGIGIATSWLPMVFAIFLSEMTRSKLRRGIQTLTTIPNFISWVLVYSVAFAIFSSEGFLNWVLMNLGVIEEGTNWLMSGDNVWLRMWAWGTWRGLGWGAIIYLAAISGIDPQLYEAAEVDGAGRFRKMWSITVPGLLSTYFVLLLLSISNILNTGMEQYLVFYNPRTARYIETLDLYVFHLGLAHGGGNIPMATLVGMLRSFISVVLLFTANRASKWIRGESIV